MNWRALTRAVPDSIERCQLTHLARSPIDLARARRQHAAYEAALQTLGCVVERVAGAMGLPDSVFVEDTAVVLDELAVITRPGAPSRRGEMEAVADSLAPYRTVLRIEDPATMDGGDVLQMGRRVFVGVGTRTNRDGVAAFRDAVQPLGYVVIPVEVQRCLHLKSAVTAVSDDAVLLNPACVDPQVFLDYEQIEVDPREPYAANVLRIGSTVICPASAPLTITRLEARGLRVLPLDVSELAKAEAGLTCCSVVFREPPSLNPSSLIPDPRIPNP
jgi:dimethylargininase